MTFCKADALSGEERKEGATYLTLAKARQAQTLTQSMEKRNLQIS